MQLKTGTAALLLAGALSGVAAADEALKPADTAKTAAPASPMDDKATMEAWMKIATPSAAHKWLEPLVGAWDAKVTMWMAPGAPPEMSTGTSETKWVLGGRFLEQRYEGSFMGQPFSGVGYTGYDNYKGKYVGTWMDTMGTMIMVSQGEAVGKTLAMTSTVDDVFTGKPTKIKNAVKIVDPDHHVMEMWGPDSTGQQFKTMEIHYTRKK
jgi:hypothetical protein